MRALVTGASGHIGGAVAADLAAAGYEVIGLGRRRFASPALSRYLRIDLGVAGAGDEIRAGTPHCDVVVHAAAVLGPSLDDGAMVAANCLGTQEVVRLALAWQPRQLIYFSSVPVIGTPRQLPITEEHPTDPPSAYHASKLFGEALVRLAARQGLAVATLRLTSPVGPGMAPDRILSIFVHRALSGRPLEVFGRGTRRQNYVDVRDLVAGLRACLELRATGLYHVAGQRSIANLELARRCVEVLGSRSRVELVDAPDSHDDERWQVSIDKARRAFGYRPRYPIEQSIAAIAAELAAGAAEVPLQSPAAPLPSPSCGSS